MSWRRGRAWACAAAVWACAAGSGGQIAGQTVKGFRLPEYDADGKLTQLLFGETATFLADGVIKLTGLQIEIYRDGEPAARIQSPECAYDPGRKRAASQEHVRIVVEKAVLTGDGFAWNGENEQFQIFRNAKVVLDAQMDAAGMLAPKAAERDGTASGEQP